MAIRATGAGELHRIAAMCRVVASDGQIGRDVTRVTLQGREPIRAAFKAHAMSVLPKRGGLNAWVAESRMTFRPRSSGVTVRVSKAGHDLAGLDRGLVIHPFYGHGPWFNQAVVPESISEPIRDEGGSVLEAACLFALEHAAERIARA